MAIAATVLTSTHTTTDSTRYTTASIAPSDGALVLVFLAIGDTDGADLDASSITGAGSTFASVVFDQRGTANQAVSIWRAQASTYSTGALTIDFTSAQGNIAWTVVQFTGVFNASSNNGASAIAQSDSTEQTGANVSITLDSTVPATHATAGISQGNTQTPVWAAGAGFTELGDGWSMSSPSAKGTVIWSSEGTNPIQFSNDGTPACVLAAVDIIPAATVAPANQLIEPLKRPRVYLQAVPFSIARRR